MDGKSVPCVHRRSGWCLARSIKINLLRNALGRYVLSFSKVKYLCGPDWIPAAVTLYFSFAFFLLLETKGTPYRYLHHVLRTVQCMSLGQSQLRCTTDGVICIPKKRERVRRRPGSATHGTCMVSKFSPYADKRGGKIDKPDLEQCTPYDRP